MLHEKLVHVKLRLRLLLHGATRIEACGLRLCINGECDRLRLVQGEVGIGRPGQWPGPRTIRPVSPSDIGVAHTLQFDEWRQGSLLRPERAPHATFTHLGPNTGSAATEVKGYTI